MAAHSCNWALERLRQDGWEFEASLGNTWRLWKERGERERHFLKWFITPVISLQKHTLCSNHEAGVWPCFPLARLSHHCSLIAGITDLSHHSQSYKSVPLCRSSESFLCNTYTLSSFSWFIHLKNINSGQDTVVHTCNPSYSGGRNQ
jgi:hypothetical protein